MKTTVSTIAIGVALATAMGCSGVTAGEPQRCTTNADCQASEFCDTTPRCPGDGVSGSCAARPELCTMDYRPVTACNGREYPNACAAASDGQPHIGTRDDR